MAELNKGKITQEELDIQRRAVASLQPGGSIISPDRSGMDAEEYRTGGHKDRRGMTGLDTGGETWQFEALIDEVGDAQ